MIRTLIFVFLLLFTVTSFNGGLCAADPLARPTTYGEMVRELAADQRLSPLIHVSVIGRSAKEKRAIPMVRLGTPGPATTTIMVLCRQHGDEPSGTEGALAVINGLCRNPAASKRFKSLCLYIVPMVNPDGAEMLTRRSGVDADLNRDWGVFRQPETIAVKDAVLATRPEFILDVHSWDMIDPFQQVCLEGPRSSSSIGPSLLRSVADLQARAAYGLGALSHQYIAATTYGPDSEDTLAHRYFLQHLHIASLLFETAPGPNYGSSLTTRAGLAASLLEWLITDTSLHPDAWQRLAKVEPQIVPVPASRTGTSIVRSSPSLPTRGSPLRAPWIPLIAGCAAIAWLVWNSRSSSVQPERLPARQRRLAHTSLAATARQPALDRMVLRRKYANRLTLIDEVKRRRIAENS